MTGSSGVPAPGAPRVDGAPGDDPADFSPAPLITERMRLRPFTAADVDDLVALDRDPLVRRFVEDGQPVTSDRARTAIERWLASAAAHEACGCWAAVERESDRFLGWFHLFVPDRRSDRERVLGYRLGAAHWGRGLATEGSRALIAMAFDVASVERVTAETLAVHAASRRVMEKCGMRLARAFRAEWPVRLPGDEHGDVEYEITREMWDSRRPPR